MQNVKQKQYCNRFNKDFKNGPKLKKIFLNFKKKKDNWYCHELAQGSLGLWCWVPVITWHRRAFRCNQFPSINSTQLCSHSFHTPILLTLSPHCGLRKAWAPGSSPLRGKSSSRVRARTLILSIGMSCSTVLCLHFLNSQLGILVALTQ